MKLENDPPIPPPLNRPRSWPLRNNCSLPAAAIAISATSTTEARVFLPLLPRQLLRRT